MTYVHCPSCGHKALDVASRCPRCGAPFEEQFSQRRAPAPKPRRFPVGLLIAVAVGAGVWVVAARLEPPGTVPATRPSPPTDSAKAPRPAPVRASLALTADSAPPDSAPLERALPSARALAPSSEASGESGATVRRYTTTWVNVRAGRNNRAAVVGVLRPRVMVMARSFEGGWYRVLNQPQAQGFVDGRFLAEVPPAAPR